MALVVKNLPANTGMQQMRVQSLDQEDFLEKEMAPTSVSFPGKFHEQRSLAGWSPCGHKDERMRMCVSVWSVAQSCPSL